MRPGVLGCLGFRPGATSGPWRIEPGTRAHLRLAFRATGRGDLAGTRRYATLQRGGGAAQARDHREFAPGRIGPLSRLGPLQGLRAALARGAGRVDRASLVPPPPRLRERTASHHRRPSLPRGRGGWLHRPLPAARPCRQPHRRRASRHGLLSLRRKEIHALGRGGEALGRRGEGAPLRRPATTAHSNGAPSSTAGCAAWRRAATATASPSGFRRGASRPRMSTSCGFGRANSPVAGMSRSAR